MSGNRFFRNLRHLALCAVCVSVALGTLVVPSGAGFALSSQSPFPCTDQQETLCGDGGPATDARLLGPAGIATDPDGSFLIADTGNDAVRRVLARGTIVTVAGIGSRGFSGDRGRAVAAQLDAPADVSPTSDGGFLIADTGNGVIRRVSSQGIIITVAGKAGGSSDGTPPSAVPRLATDVRLSSPEGVTAVRGGGYFIADTGDNVVLRVSANGLLTVVAGTGVAGYTGDGGSATAARLNSPTRVIPRSDGGFLVLDVGNHRVRAISPGGIISTLPGTTTPTDTFGDPVTPDRNPGGLAVDARGNVFVVLGHQVARISPNGSETVVAGTGVCGTSGDGGSARDATLAMPSGLAITASGDLLVTDVDKDNVRRIASSDGSIGRVAGGTDPSPEPGCIAAGGRPTGALWPFFYITQPRGAHPHRAITIQFITSQPTNVRTALLKGARTVRVVQRSATAGPNSVTLSPGVPAGIYTMRISGSADLPNNNPDAGGTVHEVKEFHATLRVR